MISHSRIRISLLLGCFATSVAFLSPVQSISPPRAQKYMATMQHQRYLQLRGGSDEEAAAATAAATEPQSTTPESANSKQPQQMASAAAFLMAGAQMYSKYLESNPILTKSITAGFIFAASDVLAQKIEQNAQPDKAKRLEKKRTLAASLVGFLYFGPAAHYWYENIFRFFPGTSLFSTLQKAAMGQLLFGPSFTCIFFATSLIQTGNFTLGNWMRKMKSDLFGAWLAGVGFWPLVDLVSYSLIPKRYIPLFINVMSLVWNIYLSIVANRKAKTASE